MHRNERIEKLKQAMANRIVVLDGAMGTMIQRYSLQEEDYRGERFADWEHPVKGNNELLSLTRPDIITEIHRAYFEAGADIAETNTFGANRISQADYHMEPLSEDFDLQAFHRGLRARHAAIKQVLLAGDVVVGVGNIYASEALFLAGIRPTLRASRLSRPRAARLREAIRDVLVRAVEKGGSTLRDFSNAQGESGYFQLEAMVYDRAGQPCRVCATPVRIIRQGQRATYFCPTCQKT